MNVISDKNLQEVQQSHKSSSSPQWSHPHLVSTHPLTLSLSYLLDPMSKSLVSYFIRIQLNNLLNRMYKSVSVPPSACKRPWSQLGTCTALWAGWWYQSSSCLKWFVLDSSRWTLKCTMTHVDTTHGRCTKEDKHHANLSGASGMSSPNS